MSSIAFQRAAAAWEAVAEHAEQATAFSRSQGWEQQRWQQLERIETLERTLPALRHELINQLAGASVEELGGTLPRMLADRLRIRRGEAARRIEEAADLAPRLTLTGESLPPRLAATAAGQQEGSIGGEHLKIIRGFFARLPSFIDEPTRADAEQKLAAVAGSYRPDELQRFADHLDLVLNPDGTFSDEDRARRRGVNVGPQGPDGMSRVTGWLNPELRAGLDAVLRQARRTRHVQPRRRAPVVDGHPVNGAIAGDTRTKPNATTMRSTLRAAPYWRPANWAASRGYRPPSLCPPPCKNCNRGPGPSRHRRGIVVADARCYPAGLERFPLPHGFRQATPTPLYLGRPPGVPPRRASG